MALRRILFAMTGLAFFTSQTVLAAAQDSRSAPFSLEMSGTPNAGATNQAPIKLAAIAPSGDNALPVVELNTPQSNSGPIDLTADTPYLFERLRNGFAMPDIYNDLVLHHMQWYQNHPDALRRMVERGSLYMHYIVEELEKRNMPTELALLPMVESAFNPTAYSRARASGLWQFIPSTGKHFNLDQNWWQDERRDIVASTNAALDYLQSLYEMHGDWHLALASYNWGEGSVARAISKNEARGLPTDYLSLTMPQETRNYVPKLQALKNIFSNPALVAQLRLPRIPNTPYFSTISRPDNIDISLAAQLAEMPVKDFMALNPSHNRPVIKSDTPMVIPTAKLDTFMNNLEAHESSNKPLSSWQSYTLRPGEKLESIAPRFGMSVAKLKEVNGLSGRMRPNPGLTLLVTDNGAAGGDEIPTLGITPPEPSPVVAVEKRAPTTPATVTQTQTHTVKKGETLASIAKQYKVSESDLIKQNKISGKKVAVGTKLKVTTTETIITRNDPSPSTKGKTKIAREDKTEPRNAKDKSSAKSKAKVARYTVKAGDTVYSIAKRFNVDTDNLMRTNKIKPASLKPGKTISIELAQSDH